MAEQWQVFSLPGALRLARGQLFRPHFRRAKTAMTGPVKMPSDPLEEQRAELQEMDRLISSLIACAGGSRKLFRLLVLSNTC